MKLSDAAQIFTEWARKDRVIFTRHDLRKLFFKDNDAAFAAGIEKLIQTGFLHRISRGLYVYRMMQNRNRYFLDKIAIALRPDHYNYLSLESALSEYGIISQVPLWGFTIITTGRAGIFNTPYGSIEFTHTKRKPLDILTHIWDRDKELPIARPGTAARDLRRVGRNVYLIDEEELEEAIANDPSSQSE